MDTEILKGTLILKREDFLIPLDNILIECSNSVYLGLSNLEDINNVPESLSGEDNFHYHKPYGGNLPIEKRKEIYKRWILQKGFEDLMKAVTFMLIDICKVLTINTKIKDIKTWGEFVKTINTPDYEPTTKHFPQLLNFVRPYLTDKLFLEDEINSINRVRRCLVHRNGLMTPVDFFEQEKTLKLKWRYFKPVYFKDGQEIEIRPPVTVLEGGGQIIPIEEKKVKEFRVGEQVEFNFQIFNELIMTCKMFGKEVVDKLVFEKRQESNC